MSVNFDTQDTLNSCSSCQTQNYTWGQNSEKLTIKNYDLSFTLQNFKGNTYINKNTCSIKVNMFIYTYVNTNTYRQEKHCINTKP